MGQRITPTKLTVEEFIEHFRQRYGHYFLGQHATVLINCIRNTMDQAEAKGLIEITNRNGWLTK